MSIEEIKIGSTAIKFYDDFVEDKNKKNLDMVIAEFMIDIKNKNVVISEKESYNN